MDVDACLERGFLRRIQKDGKLIEKELEEARFDLDKAKDAFDDENHKWAIIMAYYSIFHAAKAILFTIRLR